MYAKIHRQDKSWLCPANQQKSKPILNHNYTGVITEYNSNKIISLHSQAKIVRGGGIVVTDHFRAKAAPPHQPSNSQWIFQKFQQKVSKVFAVLKSMGSKFHNLLPNFCIDLSPTNVHEGGTTKFPSMTWSSVPAMGHSSNKTINFSKVMKLFRTMNMKPFEWNSHLSTKVHSPSSLCISDTLEYLSDRRIIWHALFWTYCRRSNNSWEQCWYTISP